LAERLRAEGRKPLVMPLGGSSPEGMAGYVMATAELIEQFRILSIAPDRLYVGVGSGGTFSGLALGQCNLDPGYRLTGISVSRPAGYLVDKIVEETGEAARLLGLPKAPRPEHFEVFDDYVGAHYGAPTRGACAAISLVARLEGVLLDPVYSGKAMHGLIDHIRQGRIGAGETVVFLHTGGMPALFAYDPAVLLDSEAA